MQMNYVDPPSVALDIPPRAIRVFVAEDHQITLWGLRQLIDASGVRMEVVGTASSRTELLNHDAAASADVILLDLDLGGEDAVASLACLRQRCPGRVLILTASDNADQHCAAMVKGVCGVVHKSAPAETILRAIEKVHNGEIWLDRVLMSEVLGLLTNDKPATAPRQTDPDAQRIANLTAREREIIVTMVHSAGAKQFAVANELGISDHTLRNHLTSIYRKLGLRGRLELHVFSTLHGLGAATRSRDVV